MDHKPLGSIMLKPLNKAPSRLQRMLLQLQRYSQNVKYKVGKQMFIANTLSRANLPATSTCEFVHSLEEMDHTISHHQVLSSFNKSNMYQRITQYCNSCEKRLGIDGHRVSQMFWSAYVHTMTSEMS